MLANIHMHIHISYNYIYAVYHVMSYDLDTGYDNEIYGLIYYSKFSKKHNYITNHGLS